MPDRGSRDAKAYYEDKRETKKDCPSFADRGGWLYSACHAFPKGDGNQQTSAPVSTPKAVVEYTPEVTQNPLDESIDASDLYRDIYLPYAERTKPRVYNAVLTMAKSCGYPYAISKEGIVTITIYASDDKNGDYVYFGFFDDNYSDLLYANTVSYYKADERKEVSFENYSTDFNLRYDNYRTHGLGEGEKDATNPAEQTEFLFG